MQNIVIIADRDWIGVSDMNVLEKILQEIKKEQNSYEADHAWNYSKGLEYAKEIIRSHMEVENAEIEPVSKEFLKDCAETSAKYKRNADGWIPVEKKLPEVQEENPIFDNKPLELYLVDIGAEYPIRAFWNGREFTDGWSLLNVIAWQPLPERYKGGDDRA